MLFTSESVSEGHPDKISDQISDAILDACIQIDKNAKVACEVFCCFKKIIISGEIKMIGDSKINFEAITRKVLLDIGYDSEEKSLDGNNFPIEILINKQSSEINDVVVHANDDINQMGAGDQGIMFGYACNHTKNYMPLPIDIANELMKTANKIRHQSNSFNLYPDMKSQVTIDFTDNSNPTIKNIVISAQTSKIIFENFLDFKKNIANGEIFKNWKKEIIKNIIIPSLNNYNIAIPKEDIIFINPFYKGGPKSDAGLTGRKIIADTYGGWSRHGGGAFSGKDGSKVDRSGAYMARYIAKNIVAAKIAKECEIQIGYVIGNCNPTSIYINTFKTSDYDDLKIINMINKIFDLKPQSMIKKLKLDTPIFSSTTCYGHFGKPNLPWEVTDKVAEIKKYFNLSNN